MPLLVPPPLLPLNAMHGGEYGSPGTWSLRSEHGFFTAGDVDFDPLVPAAPAVPAWPGVPSTTEVSSVGWSPAGARLLSPLPLLTLVALTFLDGTRRAINSTSTAKTASGPYPRNSRCPIVNVRGPTGGADVAIVQPSVVRVRSARRIM